jgi:hypothetical protein
MAIYWFLNSHKVAQTKNKNKWSPEKDVKENEA